MKFLTLNLYKGKCLKKVLSFLQNEKFDLIHLQEVSGHSVSFDDIDCFTEIQKNSPLKGELFISWHRQNAPQSYFGNATFFHPSFKVQERRNIWLRPFREIEGSDKDPSLHPRSALFLRLSDGTQAFWSINTHLAWGPTPQDAPYKIEQARILAREIEKLDAPFILSGDFNVVKDTEVVRLLESSGSNVTKDVTNTLNPRLHRVKELFPPGLSVDFIITDPSIRAENLEVLEKLDLSDHLGIRGELFLP